jgi:hypothetical protein
MTQAEMLAELNRLKAENEALKAAKPVQKLTLKIGEKGALSVYGMGRFPVTLYKSQWLKLIEAIDSIKAFIVANDAILKDKGA